jgi:hypothetical protein
MRAKFRRALLIGAVCLATAGCTSAGATRRGIVTFNKVFSDARNEILLLNILRARDGEPQQFSTVTNVSGNMRPTLSIEGALDNLSQGLAEVFKPKASGTLRNPTVTIGPLETKEFRAGMMTPVGADLVENLLNAGWRPDVVLNLVMARKPCTRGEPPIGESEFLAKRFSSLEPRPAKDGDIVGELLLPASVALKMLREGAGNDTKLELLDSRKESKGRMRIRVRAAGQPSTSLIKWNEPVCGANELDAAKAPYRSPLAMIQHLGTLTRTQNTDGSWGNPYFNIRKVLAGVPEYALTGARSRNTVYFVPRLETAPDGKPSVSRSAETLAVLAEIIGFQTMNATLNASKPVITIPAGDSG